MIESIGLLIFGSFLLYLGSEWIVRGGVGIAEKYGFCIKSILLPPTIYNTYS